MLHGCKEKAGGEAAVPRNQASVKEVAPSEPESKPEWTGHESLLAPLAEDLRSNRAAEGERKLLLAVLEDAIHCYQSHFSAREAHRRRLFAEAEVWLMQGSVAQPTTDPSFSFPYVCDVLGIDAGYIRRCLHEWSARSRLATTAPRVA